MRRCLVIILLCVQCLSVFASKRALLVGIGHYPSKSGWAEISSINDIYLLQQVFSSFSTTTLVDKQATYADIIKAIEQLIHETNPKDTVFVHFSCHGQQLLTTDKNEPDLLDEALVPYDAYSRKSKYYNGEKHLRDDEIGKFIVELRREAGPGGLVVVTLDACFSDSMDKGRATKKNKHIYRGGADIFGINEIDSDSISAILKKRKEADFIGVSDFSDESPLVLLSACKSYQKNMEVVKGNKGYGSLSYAMFSSFTKNGIDDLFHWLDGIYHQMKKDVIAQTPQVRTTLEYTFPIPQRTLPKQTETPVANQTEHYYIFIGALALLVVLVTLFAVVWNRKKNNS